jgi:hypothetical protein
MQSLFCINRQANDVVKISQCTNVFIEDCDIHGAGDNAVEIVGTQYGHVHGCRIHDASDWCMFVKGGSAYFSIAENEIFNCGNGGFTAGQGAGMELMVLPWVHYQAYAVTVVHNIVHDTEGAGLGVNGGFNVIMAHNTLYRVGARSHLVEFVHGSQGCDGAADMYV